MYLFGSLDIQQPCAFYHSYLEHLKEAGGFCSHKGFPLPSELGALQCPCSVNEKKSMASAPKILQFLDISSLQQPHFRFQHVKKNVIPAC